MQFQKAFLFLGLSSKKINKRGIKVAMIIVDV